MSTTLAERIQWILDSRRRPDGAPWDAKGLSLAAGLATSHVGQLARGSTKNAKLETVGAIAKAADVSTAWLATGQGSPDDGGPRAKPAPQGPHVELDPAPPDVDGSPLERALGQAFDAARHIPRDLRAVEDAMGSFMRRENLDGDLVDAARRWLDAAAAMRRTGDAVTTEALLYRVSVGKGQLAAEAHTAHREELRADVAARVAAFQASAGDDVDPVDHEAVARLKATAARNAKKGGRG